MNRSCRKYHKARQHVPTQAPLFRFLHTRTGVNIGSVMRMSPSRDHLMISVILGRCVVWIVSNRRWAMEPLCFAGKFTLCICLFTDDNKANVSVPVSVGQQQGVAPMAAGGWSCQSSCILSSESMIRHGSHMRKGQTVWVSVTDCVGQCDRTLVTTIGNNSVTIVDACQNPMPVLIVIWTRIVGYLAASWVNVED